MIPIIKLASGGGLDRNLFTSGGYISTSTPSSPASAYFSAPGQEWQAPVSVPVSQILAQAGGMIGGLNRAPANPIQFVQKESSSQRLAAEAKARDEAMREWQKQWKSEQEKYKNDLRDRLAEIRQQGIEQRKTSRQEYEQAAQLQAAGQGMSKEQILAQILSSLGMF